LTTDQEVVGSNPTGCTKSLVIRSIIVNIKRAIRALYFFLIIKY